MNEEENLNPELNQEAIRDARSSSTNTKIVKTVAKAAANYFAPGIGGQVAEIASKTKIGNDAFNAGGEALTGVTKAMPFGNKIQNTLNKADDIGAVDMAGSALDMKNGSTGDSSLANATQNSGVEDALSLASSSNSGLSSDSGISFDSNNENPEKLKSFATEVATFLIMRRLKYYFIGAFIGVVLIVILMFPDTTLTLTDGDSGVRASVPANTNVFSEDQIEKLLIYVGDSRTGGMKDTLNKNQINYIFEIGKGYNWYVETGKNELSAYIAADTQKFVVLALGINDLANIDQYINVYNTLLNGYKNVKFYFMSVNPINEELAIQNGIELTNKEIEEFNQKLLSSFKNNYIDVYSEIKDSFETTDGIHYNDTTYQKIHEIVVKYLKQKNILTFLGEYPSVKASKILEGISITSVIGEDGINTLNNFINEQINIGGKCTGAGVAGAGVGLIYGLHQQGYHLPYYYGGGHGENNGIDFNWGLNIGQSIPNPKGNVYYYSGLDSSGFIAWAMNTAEIGGEATAGNYTSIGTEITFEEASPGDLLDKDDHVIMIIENKGTYLQCAESTNGGVQFTKKTKTEVTAEKYKIVDMNNYYQNNCTL